MDDDIQYTATMRALVHVYRTRDNLVAACVAGDTERLRWLLIAASMWLSAQQTQRALSMMENDADRQNLRRDVWRSIYRTRVSSYACYRNSGFGFPHAEADMKCADMQTAVHLHKWDPQVQSVSADGSDAVLELFDTFTSQSQCQQP